MNELSVNPVERKNPTDALTPLTGVGCVFPDTDSAIIYPSSSSGPFHH